MTSLLIERCRVVVTMDDNGTELDECSIGIEDGWITLIGDAPEDGRWDQRIDGERFLAVPGLINTHHHLYQTLTRGFPESEGKSLFRWLEMLYPIWAGLDEDMVYSSTRTGLAELLLSGCTTCSDHLYVFPEGSESFVDAQVEAAASLQVRFHPTRGSMDLGQASGGLPPDEVVQPLDRILSDSDRAVHRYHNPEPGSMVRIGLAPCSPFSASADLMRESAALARSHAIRLHTHIAETLDEHRYSLERYGMSPIELLSELDWLAPDVWVAHCVHPDARDMDSLAENRVGVAHCPTSNMLLGSGMAPVPALLDRGVSVGLGVDGSASNDGNDLRNEVKQAVLVARTREGPGALSAREALRLATRGGAQCLGREDIGSLEVGKAADLVLFDLGRIEYAGGLEDPLSAVILGAGRPHTVVVHGQILVRAGTLLRADADTIAAQQNHQAARLMKKWRET